MNRIGNEHGAAMIIALTMLLMLGLVGAASIQTSSTDMSISDNYRQDVRSFYLAEAGVEHACGILRDSADWREGLSDVVLGGGAYSTRILDADSIPALDDTILVISSGVRSGARSIVAVRLLPDRPFRWAAFGDDRFDLNGGTVTDSYDSDSGSYAVTQRNEDGDVGSNGTIGINGNATINGDASTSSPGDMTIEGSSVVTGDTTTAADVITLDPVTQDHINNAKAVSPAPGGMFGMYNFNAGSKSLSVQPGKTLILAGGTYYFSTMDFKGNVQVQPGATVKIYTDGDFHVDATATVNTLADPEQLQIFCRGAKVTVNGGAEIHSVIYAPESLMEFNGNGVFYGAYIAADIQQNGAAQFHYDRALRHLSWGGMSRVAWQEL
ncbi:MAG: pilus assembly PilX N-terminal domain-containing protein [Candidatus Zixiibacteriota bacterium]